MPADLRFSDDAAHALAEADAVLVIGRAQRLLRPDVVQLVAPYVPSSTWSVLVRSGDATWDGRLATTWRDATPLLVGVGVLPERSSRGHGTSRAWAVPALVEAISRRQHLAVVLATDEADDVAAQVLAVARVVPAWRAGRGTSGLTVITTLGSPVPEAARLAAHAVRRAAAWTDRPPNDLGVDAFVDEASAAASRSGMVLTVIRGEAELMAHRLGGLWAVGKASTSAPALVVLEHAPASPRTRVAWIGKGIVYDTGGLSIKGKTAMPGMKMDMAGAAAVLAAAEALVTIDPTVHLTAVLALAENSVGPGATRPDDVIEMRSGRFVEVNNTDAEGRLVLADALAWVATERPPHDLVVDIATLTGAQMGATGKRVGGVYAPDEATESAVLQAGRRIGEPFHPLPVFPEYHRREFRSAVADLKNSVADRDNAQSSCAAWFLHDALEAVACRSAWAHLDICGPAIATRRATGFGVGVLLELAGAFRT